jgi:hypothetical protein
MACTPRARKVAYDGRLHARKALSAIGSLVG